MSIARQCLAAFFDTGINTFFDLTRPGELPSYLPILQEEAVHYGIPIDYQRFNIQDKGLPSHEQMAVLLDALDAALAAGIKSTCIVGAASGAPVRPLAAGWCGMA